nr:hypothetical protein [Streptomyces tsukubensis NRRL18488]
MTAATDNRPFQAPIRSRTSAAERATDAIPPRPASATTARLLRATTFAPSSSDSPPATHAAATSPCECPTTPSGTMPCDRHTSANDTITAHSTGCTTSTASSEPDERTTSVNDQST